MDKSHTIINIGRQFGSGGRLVAKEIGKRLGIKVYDSELIAKAAEDSGFSKEFFERSDERRSLFNLSFLFENGRFSSGGKGCVSDNELFSIQSSVIRGIADAGPAVFIGRCSNYILRDRCCLDVFITAPIEDRIKRVASRMGATAEEARSTIEKMDRNRQTYYNFFTYGEWGGSSDYDLCVSSSVLGIEGTAELIIDFGRKAGLV